MHEYLVEVVFKRPKHKDKIYNTRLKFNYTDDTFMQCEHMIRDELKHIGDKFINDEFYR